MNAPIETSAFTTIHAMASADNPHPRPLRAEDVDLQRDRLTISKSITRIGGRMVETDPKTHEKRVVMFPVVLLPALKAQCADRRPTDFLFTAPMSRRCKDSWDVRARP